MLRSWLTLPMFVFTSQSHFLHALNFSSGEQVSGEFFFCSLFSPSLWYASLQVYILHCVVAQDKIKLVPKFFFPPLHSPKSQVKKELSPKWAPAVVTVKGLCRCYPSHHYIALFSFNIVYMVRISCPPQKKLSKNFCC